MLARLSLARWSLRRTLLAILLPAMLIIGSAEFLVSYHTTVDAANSAYDRSLLGAIKAIDANISTDSGGVAVELPYRMLEFFELTASGNVYFRVATEDGLAEVGNANLPSPDVPLSTRRPYFYDAVYFGEKVRVGAYARPLSTPLSLHGQRQQRIVIQVAETLDSRNAFIRNILLQAIARDAVLMLAAAVLLVVALNMALRPLTRLRDEISLRMPLDVTPIDAAAVPHDVRPLVEAVNHHVERHQRVISERRRFIDDASHQLRTPLATLRTQLDYILREQDDDQAQQALSALSRQLNDAIRSTNQMLTLARVGATDPVLEPVDLQQVARLAVWALVPQARNKKIDLGLEGTEQALMVRGHAALLQEAITNLVDNAIRFAPVEGHVTVHLSGTPDEAVLTVTDDGPGIPDQDLPQVGERFFRASNAVSGGSGLGLAIASSVARRHQGQIRIANLLPTGGCVVTMRLPLASGPAR